MAGRATRVTEVSKWTLGGGGRVRDLFPMNPWLKLLLDFCWWWISHWKVSGQVALFIVVWTWSHTWQLSLVAVLVVWFSVAVVWYLRHGRGSTPSELRGTIRSYGYLLRVQRRWHAACLRAGIADSETRKPPPLRRLRAIPAGVEAQVDCGKIGRTSDEVVHAGMQIAAFMKADHVSVATVSPGHARLVLNWGDPTGRELTLSDMPAPQGGHICFGLDPDSDPVAIRADRSLLCVGETGSGKSNIIWALLAGLNEAGVPYRLRIIDPAGGVEFTNLEDSPRTKVYVDRANKAEKVITDARDAMNARLAWMKKHNVPELVEATPENPLDITIIDELLLLGDMIKKGVLSPIGEVLSVGRKGLYVVWALSQLSQVDTLGRIRDLFAQRLCLSTGSREMTEAALGPSAEAMGAKCSKIPLSTPGVGYRYLNGQKGFTRFRSVHVPKKGDTRYQIAQGGIPSDIHRAQQVKAKQQRDLQKQRTAVYRLRDRKGVLLYVGITNNPTTRMAEHAAEKVWWTEVDQSQTSISWYGNRAKAKAEETKAITSERPRWNVSEATEGAKQ